MNALARARARVDRHMREVYQRSLDDLTITDTPGYWQDKTHCGGRGVCSHPVHAFMFNEGGCQHTYVYFDPARAADGRWATRTASWRTIKDATAER